MKTKGILIIMELMMLSSCGGFQRVPMEVEIAFGMKFPTAYDLTWGMENDIDWEGEFKIAGAKYSAIFDPSGYWKETEHEIKMGDLPDAVKVAILEKYPNYKVKEVEECETADAQHYEVFLKKDKEKVKVLFENSGLVLNVDDGNDSDDD